MTQPLMSTKLMSFVLGCMVSALFLPQVSKAQSCDIRSTGVAGISLGDFNPLARRGLSRDLSFGLTGPVGARAWIRVQTAAPANAHERVDIEFFGLANSGLARIDTSATQALASDVGTLNTSWLPVFFDAQGQGVARVIAQIPETAYAMAGSQTDIVNLSVACEQDGLVQVDSFPVTVASLHVRVVSAIRVTDPTSNVLRFGNIPDGNPDGYSPSSAWASLSVASTGGFDVKLSSADWLMRGVTETGGTGRDSIPYRAVLTTGTSQEFEATDKPLNCGASASAETGQLLEIRAKLPANAAQGKMAGLYRGHLTVEISPLELSGASQTKSCDSL
jgi:hypothetical protein